MVFTVPNYILQDTRLRLQPDYLRPLVGKSCPYYALCPIPNAPCATSVLLMSPSPWGPPRVADVRFLAAGAAFPPAGDRLIGTIYGASGTVA